MKYLLLSFFLLLFFFVKTTFSQTAFYKRFSEMEECKMISTSDGGYLIAGERSFLNSIGDIEQIFQIIKLNVVFDTMWTKSYSGHMLRFTSIKETYDDGFILSGMQQDSGHQYDEYISIVRLDSSGNMEWTRHFHYADAVINGYLSACIELADSSIMIIGSNVYLVAGVNYLWTIDMIKLDRNGSMLWSKKRFTNTGEDIFAFGLQPSYGFQQLSDGSFLIAGFINSNPYISYVMRVDNNGNLIRCKIFSGTNTIWIEDIALSTNANYYLYGRYNPSGQFPDYPLVMKLDSQDNVIWAKCYLDNQCSDIIDFENSDGVNSTFTYVSYNDLNNLVHIDSSGHVTWTKSFPPDSTAGSTFYQNFGILKTPDRGFLLSFLDNRLELVKTDSLGNAFCRDFSAQLSDSTVSVMPIDITSSIADSNFTRISVDVGVYDTLMNINSSTECLTNNTVNEFANSNKYKLFPNPTAGILTIDLSEQFEWVDVSVIDILGQNTGTTKYTNAYKLNVEINGECGIYLIKLTTREESVVFKVLKM